MLNLAVVGRPSLLVRLRRPVRARRLFGTHREACLIGISVDDPVAFRAALAPRDLSDTSGCR